MIHRRVWPSLLMAALALLMWTVAAAQGNYTFTRIADTSGPFSLIEGTGPASINDVGQVVFTAELKTGGTGVFLGSGGPVTTVADTSGVFSFFGFASVNGLGQPSFFANKRSFPTVVPGVFAGIGGTIPIVTIGGRILEFDGDPFSSHSGSLTVITAALDRFGNAKAIVSGNGGPVTNIADTTSGLFSDLDLDPRVNGSGQVAFHGIRTDQSEGIFIGNGGPPTTIADTSGSFSSFADNPDINDKGDILFQATLKSPGGSFPVNGLFLSSHGKITTILDSNGPFGDFGFSPGINVKGQIAFLGNGSGIFTGDDPVADRVIGIGDPLDGSTVAGFGPLDFWAGLNNHGQIAFMALLADGHNGVYRADAIDQIPPRVTAHANPHRISPDPYGKMVRARISGKVKDRMSSLDLDSGAYSTVDSFGIVEPSGTFTIHADGTYNFEILLEATLKNAHHKGHQEGDEAERRTYRISVSARDNAGNIGRASTVVAVQEGDD